MLHSNILQTQPACNICSALKLLCGYSEIRNPAKTCMHATSLSKILKKQFKLWLTVDTGATHPNMIRENFIKNLHWSSWIISAGMQDARSSSSSYKIWDFHLIAPYSRASVCHKHMPLSQLRNCLLSLVSSFGCTALSSKNGQTVCATLRHPSPLRKHPLDA